MVNVRNKKCAVCEKKQPNFALPGERASHCAGCKLEGMVDVRSKKCVVCEKTRSSFGPPGERASHCAGFKLEGMVELVTRKCRHNEKHPGVCTQWANPKYRGYCTHCFAHLFPTDPLTLQIRHKTKETAVRDFLNAQFPELGFVHDEPLFTPGCDCTHRRRIDHRALIGSTLLCVETDEFQHRGYSPQDEEARYNDLFMVHPGNWVFIRFNPDAYINHLGERVEDVLTERLRVLGRTVSEEIETIKRGSGGELVRIRHLFYDDGVGEPDP